MNEFNLSRTVTDKKDDSSNAINIPQPPPIIIDAHMHIMTSYCTPLPLLWARMLDLRLTRPWLDRGAWLLAKFGSGTGKMGVVGKKSTIEIGDIAARNNPGDLIEDDVQPILKNSAYKKGTFPMMVTLPMDMEYAHYEGFERLKLYYMVNQRDYIVDSLFGLDAKKKLYLPPKKDHVVGYHGKLSDQVKAEFEKIRKKEEARLSDNNPSVWNKIVSTNLRTERGYRYFTFWIHPKKKKEEQREVVWLDNEEVKMFTPWPRQFEQIVMASLRHPWQILPLFHFDPRRWSGPDTLANYYPDGRGAGADTIDYYASKAHKLKPEDMAMDWRAEIVTESNPGIFLGMKMYPPLGYRPHDWDRIPGLHKYYSFCSENDVPIMTHCSPEGMFTHERPQFYSRDEILSRGLDVQNLKAAYEKEQKGEWRRLGRIPIIGPIFPGDPDNDRFKQSWEEFYFSHTYVSPHAWEKVLKEFPTLRLCLAHFGADDNGFSGWGKNKDKRHEYSPDIIPWEDKIIEMIKKYDNCYVDISYFFVEQNTDRLKDLLLNDDDNQIKDKILYGTDWYMIEMSRYEYAQFARETKKILDQIDKKIWYRFACLNPIKFYKLLKVADNLAAGMMQKLEYDSKTGRGYTTGELKRYGIKKSVAEKKVKSRLDLLKKIETDIGPYAEEIGYEM